MSSLSSSPPADRGDSAAPARAQRGRPLAIVAGLTIAVHALLAWRARAPTIGTGNDDAVYLLLARALREGHYRELFYVGTPVHSQYPPGYPSLLALLGAPMDGDVGIVIVANIVFSCAALALLYDVMRRWSAPLAVATIAVLAVNPALVLSASRVQSEPMFMAAVMLGLWALRPDTGSRHRWLAIAAVVVAALTRSAGLAVLAAVFVYFLLAHAWRHAAALAVISMLTVLPWLAWTVVAPQRVAGRSYIADALLTMPMRDSAGVPVRGTPPPEMARQSKLTKVTRTVWNRVRYTARQYLTRSLPARLAIPTVPNTPADNAAWLIAMLIAVGAGAAAAWSRWRAAVLALLFYALLLGFWPYAVGRFLIPMIPVFVALLLLGAWRIGVRVLPRAALVPALAMAAIPLTGGTQATASLVGDHESCAPDDRNEDMVCANVARRYRTVARQVDARLPEAVPVFTTKEGTFYYHTGRQVVSVYPAIGLPADSLASYLRERRVAMIFLPHARDDEEELGAPLAELCTRLTHAGSPAEDVLILWARTPGAGEENACEVIARWRATW